MKNEAVLDHPSCHGGLSYPMLYAVRRHQITEFLFLLAPDEVDYLSELYRPQLG
jgi:hypothetical protein